MKWLLTPKQMKKAKMQWSILTFILPILPMILIIFAVAIFFTAILSSSSSKSSSTDLTASGNQNLSVEVLKYQSFVTDEATRQGVPDLVPWILAIMMVESGGKGGDPMQSSESKGLAPNAIQDPEESIIQGISHLKRSFEAVKANGIGNDYKAAVQTYNYGLNYANYLGKHHLSHSLDTAEEYSRTVVAPALGNTGGIRYSYVNPTSLKFGKTYLYLNGGNFFYAELVTQYIATTSIGGNGKLPPANSSAIIKEAFKHIGKPYVWGARGPNTFDCSGFTQYVFLQVTGKDIGAWTVPQESSGTIIPVSQAKEGDLYFWGPRGNTEHVAIALGDGRFIHAPQPGQTVTVSNIQYFMPSFALRVHV